MTRHHLGFAVALIGTAVLFIPRADAVTALQCEDHAVNCEARCTDITGGAGDVRGHHDRCNDSCARQVNRCLGTARYRIPSIRSLSYWPPAR